MSYTDNLAYTGSDAAGTPLVSHVGPGGLAYSYFEGSFQGQAAFLAPGQVWLAGDSTGGGASLILAETALPADNAAFSITFTIKSFNGTNFGAVLAEGLYEDWYWINIGLPNNANASDSVTLSIGSNGGSAISGATTQTATVTAGETYTITAAIVPAGGGSWKVAAVLTGPGITAPTPATSTDSHAAGPTFYGGFFWTCGGSVLADAGSTGVVLNAISGLQALSLSPPSTTAVDGGPAVPLTPAQAVVSASLSASATHGTVPGSGITSGSSFNYNPPGSGTGTDTVTLSDSLLGISATSSIAYAPPATITPQAITVVSANSTGITVQANTTGGNGTVTYQWYTLATPNGSRTAVTGATGQTHKFQGTYGQAPVYVECDCTSNATTVTSPGYLAAALWGGSPALPYAVVPVGDPITVVLIWDSRGTTGEHFDLTSYTNALTYFFGPTTVAVINDSASGSTTYDWLTGGLLATALNGLSGITGPVYFDICLGTNNAKSTSSAPEPNLQSAANYSADIAAMIAQIKAYSQYDASTWKIGLRGTGWISAPTQYSEWTDASTDLIRQYGLALGALCDGSTVLDLNPLRYYYYFAANQALMADGVHETTGAGTQLATFAAGDLFAAIQFAAGNPGAAKVEADQAYGIFQELTGTYSGGGSSTDPGVANVLSTATYSIDGVSKTGTYHAPSAGQVESGVAFGPGSGLTGTYTGGGDGTIDPTSVIFEATTNGGPNGSATPAVNLRQVLRAILAMASGTVETDGSTITSADVLTGATVGSFTPNASTGGRDLASIAWGT